MKSQIKIIGSIDEKMLDSVVDQIEQLNLEKLDFNMIDGFQIIICSDGGFSAIACAISTILNAAFEKSHSVSIIVAGYAMSAGAIIALDLNNKMKNSSLHLLKDSFMYLHHGEKDIQTLNRINFQATMEDMQYYRRVSDAVIKESRWLSQKHKDLYFSGQDVFITNENRESLHETKQAKSKL